MRTAAAGIITAGSATVMNNVGVVDIGSNTVRAVVYSDGEIVYNKAALSRIFAYTRNGEFLSEGTKWLAETITALCAEAPACDKIRAYATSAFRDLKNRDEVAKEIEKITGIEVSILSECDEAMCDFLALKSIGVGSGTGVDLGGGSCQLVEFSDGELGSFVSLPIGCNRLAASYVRGEMPLESELLSIAELVKKEICGFKNADELYVLGGTSRLATKVRNELSGVDSSSITPEELWEIIRLSRTERGFAAVRRAARERSCSAVVGFAIIAAVAEKLGAKNIRVCKTSSREGFLLLKK